MFYGCDGEAVAVRLDGAQADLKIEVEFESGVVPAEIVVGRVTELRVPLSGHNMRLHLSKNGLPAAMLPAQGWFEVGECMALVKRVSALL